MKPDLEDLLRDYIAEQGRVDIRGSLNKILNAFTEHEAKDEIRHNEIIGQVRGVSLRVGVLERDRDRLEDKVEDTGRHEIVRLGDDAKWWKRATLGGAASIALMVLSALVTYVLGKG